MPTTTRSSLRLQSCSLFVLIAFAVLLLKSLQTGKRYGPLLPRSPCILPRSFGLVKRSLALGNESDARVGLEREVQIAGYWKEVRASLGLLPLPETILIPAELDLRLHSGAGKSDDEGEGMRLQRLGRLVPTLRRREAVFNSDSRSMEPQLRGDETTGRASSKHIERSILQARGLRQNEHADSPSLSQLDGTSIVNSGSSEDSVDDKLQTYKYPYTYSSTSYPELFIASDEHTRPRTPVSALAASFRAIAARELRVKQRGGRVHASATRPGIMDANPSRQ